MRLAFQGEVSNLASRGSRQREHDGREKRVSYREYGRRAGRETTIGKGDAVGTQGSKRVPRPEEASDLQKRVWAKREEVVGKQALVDFLYQHVQAERAALEKARGELNILREQLEAAGS
jgi:transposase-like protein